MKIKKAAEYIIYWLPPMPPTPMIGWVDDLGYGWSVKLDGSGGSRHQGFEKASSVGGQDYGWEAWMSQGLG